MLVATGDSWKMSPSIENRLDIAHLTTCLDSVSEETPQSSELGLERLDEDCCLILIDTELLTERLRSDAIDHGVTDLEGTTNQRRDWKYRPDQSSKKRLSKTKTPICQPKFLLKLDL